MKFYSKEDFVKHSTQQVKNYEDAIRAIDLIVQVVEEFNSKVLNNRLIRAINKELKEHFNYTFISEIKPDSYNIVLYCRDSDSYADEVGCCYIDYTYYIAMPVVDDNRIIAADSIELYNNNIKYIQARKNQLTQEIKDIDNIEREYKALNAKVEEFKHKYSYKVQRLYEL